MSLRVIALRYIRVSDDEQFKEGLSLPMQDRVTLKYVLANPQWLAGQLFSDVLTGKRDERRGYQALLAEVRHLRASGQPVIVVCWRLDRFGRRLVERARSWEEFVKLGVDLHSTTEGGKVNRLVAKMLAVMAEEEILVSGERIHGVLAEVKVNGWWGNGTLPYGYRGRPRTAEEHAQGAPARVLEVDPIQAPYVTEGFKRLAQGQSAGSVHRWLASLDEEARGGRVMHIRAVRLMFQSPLYIARFEADGPVGRWPALIDDETWHKAQQAFRPRGSTGREASVHYLLTGFLMCPECGRSMFGMRAPASAARKYAQSRYRCKASSYGEHCKYSATVETVDAAVLDAVGALLDSFADPEYRQRLDEAWARERSPRVVSNTQRTRKQLEREITRADQDIAGAVRLLGNERIDQAAYDALYRDAIAKQEAARKRLAELEPVPQEPELPPIDELLAPATSWRTELARGEIEAQRRVLSLLLQRVVARRVGWGKYGIAIDWTPLGRRLMLPAPVGSEQVS